MKKNLKQPLAVLLAANMALSAAAPTMSAYAEEGKTENEVENVSTVSDGKNTNKETTDDESDPKNENDSTGNTDSSDGEEKHAADGAPVDADSNENESETKDADGDADASESLNSGDSTTTDTDVAGNNTVSDDTEDDTEVELATTDEVVDNNVTTSENNTLNSNDTQMLNDDPENAVNNGINTASSNDTVTIEAYIGDNEYKTKEYDGTNKAYCSIGLRGLAAGDGGKVKIESYDATYDTSAVGDDIEITVSNIKLSGEAASKYQAALDGVTLTATGSITQRTIDVYVAAQNKKYDGTNTASLCACRQTSFVSGDKADIAVTGTFEDANAGTGKKISIDNVEITGDNANNYVIGTVKPATISGTAGNYTVTEVETLTADITKGFIAAPSVDLFSVENGNVVGFTDKMEYSTDGTTWTDCDGLTGIQAVSGTTYQFRYKGDTTNYDLGVTRYTYQGAKASVKLTYSLNGEKVSGQYPTSCTFSVGTVYTSDMLPTLTSADTDRVFTGWYTEAVGGTKITAGMTCNNTSDFTLYAHFEEDTSKQAGDIEVSAKSVMYGNYPDVTVTNAGKSDYTRFVKYYKARDAKDDTYTTTQPTDPGNYTVKVVASGSSTYKSVEKTADFSITKMQIVYTLTPKDKVYDASASVPYDSNSFTCTSGGIVIWNDKRDDANVDFTGFKVSFEDKNAGDNKKVIASGLKMTGADADKYEVSCVVNGTANITKASIAYTENAELSDNVLQYNLKAKSKTYDGTTAADVVGSVAKYSGDDIKVVAAGAFSDANAGENKTVNITSGSVTLTGTDAKNYQLEVPSAFSVTGTIRKAQNENSVSDIVKFHNPTNGLNNGSITGLTTDMEYSSDGKNTWTAATGDSVTGLAAGTYYVRYKETTNYYASDATYATLTNSGSSTTTKITVQFDVNGESVSESSVASVSATVGKTYGTLPTVTPTDANREFVGWFTDRTGGTEVTKDTVCAATDVTTLYAHYRDKSVVKSDGKITVSAADITYGDAASPSYAVVDGDYKDANVAYYYKVSGADDKTYSVTAPTAPGTYTVKAVASATANFLETSATADFKIAQKKVTVTVTANTKTYDGTTDVTGYKCTTDKSILADDEVKIDTSKAVIKFKDANVGTDKELVISGITLTGAQSDRYELVVTGTGTIEEHQKSDGKITVSAADIIYGDVVSPSYAVVDGDYKDANVTYYYKASGADDKTYSTTTPTVPGTYTVKAVANATANFLETSATADFKIAQKKVTVTVTANTKTYDGTTDVTGYKCTTDKSILADDEVKIDTSKAVIKFKDANVGTDKELVISGITLTGAQSDRYELVVTGTGTIEEHQKSDGKITVSAADIIYGDVVSPSYAVVDGDYKDANVTYYYKVSGADDKTYSTTAPTVPGTYTVKAVASATANFLETSATADFKVAQKKVTVTVTANTKTYDGTTDVTGYKCTTDKSILAGDEVKIDTSKAVIKFKDANVGTDKELVISGITLTGAQSDRYELVVIGTGTIEKRQKADGKIIVSVNDFTYGETASEVKVENTTGDYTAYETFYRKSGATNWDTTMPVNPGTYEVLVVATATDAYNETEAATTFTIKKVPQSEPTIKAESGQNLECITGTTADMEYSTNKATWHSCSDGTTSVPSSGTYYVRYKETATKAASEAVAYEVAKNEITVNFVSDKTVVKTITVKNGQTIDASQVPQLTKKGKKISCWYGFMTGRDESDSAQMFFSFNFGKDIITNEGNQVIITSDEHKEGFVADHNQTCYLDAMWVTDESSKDAGQIAVEMSDFTYGYTAPSPTKNVITGDYQTVTFQYKPADAADTAYTSAVPTLPGNYIVKATASATDTYKEAIAYDTFTINKRQLNLSVTVDAKDYDGTTDVTGYHIEAADNNIVDGDEVSLDTANASVQFASSDAGTHTLSVSGVGFTGAQKDCYEVGTISGSGTIRRKSISNITVNAEDKDYDATKNVNVTLTSSDVLSRDTVVLTGTATLDSSEPGTRTVTVTDISMSGADIGNYDLSKITSTGTMTVRDTTKNVTFDTTGVTVKGSFDGIMSLRPHDKYPALPDAESTDPEYKFVGWAKEDGTRVYEGTEYLGETSLKPVLEKITDFPYSIQYVTEAGEVLETVTGTAHNNELVTAEAKTLEYYEYTGNEAFIVKAGNTNVFKAVCKERVFNIELVMVNKTTGKIFAREKGTYSINHPYEKMSGAVPAHMHFTGFSGHSVNHGTWSFAGYESDTTWSFKLPGYVEDCWIHLGFTADPSDVTFDANGGEGSMSDVYASDVTNLPANTFTKKNYTFKGWSTTADGDVEYADGTLVSNIPSGTTLYAVWEKTTVNVKFDLGGVETIADIPPIVVALGDKYPALPVPVAKDSKVSFIGWFTKDGVEVHTGDDFDGENTLYARFKSRKEGMIELNAKDYAYGDTPDISANIVSGDYSESDISYSYREKSGTEWTNGLPELPGEYVVRATAAENEEMLSATAEADVTVSQRTLNFHLDNTGKIYNGDAVAAPTYVLDNKVENDDVTVSGTAAYDSVLPGDRVLKVTGITLSGSDAAKYKLESDTVEAKAHIDKMTAEAVCVTSRNESIWGKNDGALFSTTTAMEYRVNGEKWIDASATVTDNLESGMYEVRMKETDVSYAGPAQTVPIYADRTLKENLTDVTGNVTTYGVRYGTKIDKPADLYKSGYTFGGWYIDAAFTTKYDFNSVVTDDVYLYPKFTRNSSSGGGSSSGGSGVTDIKAHSSVSTDTAITAVNGTWTMDSDRHWRLTNGEKSYRSEWVYAVNPYANVANGQPGSSWFHFDADGIMETGWFTDTDGRMYYLNPTSDGTLGAMFTGWHWIKQESGVKYCYYFQEISDGHRGMLYKGTTTPDGYTVDETGAWTVNNIVVEK